MVFNIDTIINIYYKQLYYILYNRHLLKNGEIGKYDIYLPISVNWPFLSIAYNKYKLLNPLIITFSFGESKKSNFYILSIPILNNYNNKNVKSDL